MDKVQAALEARKRRKQTDKTETSSTSVNATQNSVDSALEARKRRITSNLSSEIATIQKEYETAVNDFKSISTPSFGEGSLREALDAQRASRVKASKLQQKLNAYRSYIGNDEAVDGMLESLKQMEQGYDSHIKTAELYSQFNTEDEFNSWYESYKKQEEEKQAILSAEDFEEYSQKGKNLDNDNNDFIIEIGDTPYGEANYIEHYRNYYADYPEIAENYGAGTISKNASFALAMTEEEVNIYNYYLAKEGKKKAKEYLKSIEESVNQRVGTGMYNRASGNKVLEMTIAAGAGIDQFASGIKNLDNFILGTEADPTSSLQYASSEVRENLDGGWGIAYDLVNTTTHMLPSILVGTVTGGIGGAATLGVSAVGNGYSEMRKLGYDEWQSRGYGFLVGASEATLQYLLGGISKLGGKVSGNAISNFLSKFDNALARTAIKLGGNMASEGLEESIQTALEPAIKALMTGEDFEAAEWDEILYSGLLGALSAGVLEGAPTIAGTVSSSIDAGKIYGGDPQALVTESLEIDPNNTHAQRMQARLDSGKNVSGYQINRLVEANESAMYENDTKAIQSATAARLSELGETGDVNAIASALTKQASGEKLTRSEKQAISSSKYGQRVANELNTKNIENGEYSSGWTGKIGTDRINAEEYNRILESAESETAETVQPTADVKQAEAEGVSQVSKGNFTGETENVSEGVSEAPVATEESSENIVDTEEASESKNMSMEDVSKKYGAQALAVVSTYKIGGGTQDVAKFDSAYRQAYDMGKSGVALDYVMKSEAASYLTEKQRELAYEAGRDSADTEAKEKDAENKKKANGKTGHKKGVVRGENVSIDDLKKTFNDTQNTAYKVLSVYAEATGIDIVLYKSEANAEGKFEGAQGRYKKSEPGTVYIDITAGLTDIKSVNDLAKYTMLRTFAHEFTHFIEKWNPIQYNVFRKLVFDTLTERGENVNDLIEEKQAATPGMSYDAASREVVAEAMTDILPDSKFIETLATEHKTIFDKLLEKLKEFVADLKAYFNSIGYNRSKEANALKDQVGETVRYAESIVQMFDKIAAEAVENYQATVATEEVRAETETATEIEADGSEFTITDNAEYGTLEIKFDGKPSEAVRDVLKENKFRWHKQKQIWYGRADRASIVQALREAYKAEEQSEHSNENGGITNVTERAEQKAEDQGGADGRTAGRNEGTLSEDGDGRGVSEGDGRVLQDVRFSGDRRGELSQTDKPFSEDSFITPKRGSVEAAEYRKLAEYGIEGYVVKKSDWSNKAIAFTHNRRIYMREDIPEKNRGMVVPHEASHVMKQSGFAPYIDFVNRTPDMINMSSVYGKRLIYKEAEHRNIDPLDMDEKQRVDLYDEINATVYGEYAAGHIEGQLRECLDEAFYDFDAYITELTEIHKQFKAENRKKKESATEAPKMPQGVTLDKRVISAFKSKDRVFTTEYNGQKYITDSSVLIAVTDADISYAKTELTLGDVRLPDATQKSLAEANILLTEAPTEAKLANKSVYAFDIGTQKIYFDKKLLSFIDGGILYYGMFTKEAGIIKSVNEDGSVKGYLLGLRVPSADKVTDEKPSKLKSFSKKMQSLIADTVKIKEEATENGENADNKRAVSQPVTDRQGNTRVLDEVEAEDVQGDVQQRDAVEGTVQRGQEAGRDDNRSDTSGVSGRSSEGDSESGDLRRNDELTAEVTEQIAQQSTEKPKGRNFVIGESLDLPNGEKARYKANVEAIRLVKKLEAEGRYATEAEQVILSKYVGWGGLANAFDSRKADWAKEYAELSEILTKEEYESARSSTLNAHYTDISVIKAMYDGLESLGFNGGRMLEPSSGVGNFVGAMPTSMSSKVKSWTMVELDGITGLIAKYLYPNADVRIQGFEKANIPDNYMDVAISNVPFGNYAIADKAYPKAVTSAIHNYFFAKTLDKVRPGGIVMFITSSYTMNSKDNAVRRYIMKHADLLGAIRLPDSAFKGNAGTEVVTDILILKKRAANTTYAGEDFLEAPYKYISGYNGANINSYFDAHPEMVLGTPSMEGGMYRGNSLTYKALEGKGSLADQIREAFTHITGKMDYPAKATPEKTNFAVERATKGTKENGLVSKAGKIYQNVNGELVEKTVAKGTAERIDGLLKIRDAARDLQNYQQQGLIDSEIRKARQKLNKAYDEFVKKYGFINSQANKNAISEDPDKYSIFALENYDSKTKKATKADIFSKNTIAPNRTVTSAKDVTEGLIVSRNETGAVDVALIARLTGKTEAEVTRELIDSRQVFKTRDGELEAAEVYLSGNVRAKLRDAEALVPLDADYEKNVEALKSVMPEDVGYQDIFVNPGTPWIPASVYSDFAAYMLGGRNTDWSKAVDVTRNKETGNFTVELYNKYLKGNFNNNQKWGTPRRSFLELFDAMLNSKSVVVKKKTADGQTEVDQDATNAANEKVESITKEFQEWLWKDEARRTELATLYNEVFNSIVTPKYNGENLTVNGANALKPLRPHQKDAVQRVISSGGNTLLAHKVGAGKTYEMAAAAMKLKQLGLVNKPMFAVPKSLVSQWGKEFMDFFPTARLLVAEATDFTAANRKVFANRIANGNYDAVILSYEQFEKLPISDDFARGLYQEQIDSIVRAIEEAKAEKGKSLSVKDLEKKRKSLQAKIDKLTDKAKDEDNIEFEKLGVDSLFIDEAHNFKNLFYTTSMTNVSGLGNKDGSKRAFDLYTKVRYLQQLNGGKGIVFATATPVMNSMSEMYIMQKYLQPDLLEQLGLNTFDAWAKQFGEVVNGVEIKPSGQGYRVKQSFSRFKNMSELQLLFRNFADVLTDIPGLKIPKMRGGKVNVVVCEPGQFQKDFMKELEKRADNIKNVDPSEDNMLKITSDGRKISYTQRMIDPSLPYEEGCKIFRCADNVVELYEESKDVKGTQLIFCDMATPKGKSKTATAEAEEIETDMESARLYDDIKARLMKGGIPAKEIAFIHEADTDEKKKTLFADVNDGKVRVLIGSTGKMGVGMNAQKRVVAIHHLDAPWRPGDVEQRNGRAFRQGNINDEVENFTYVTEGSFDARLWDILERKQNFINQVMNGENVGRETEDTGEVTLSAAEVKALASGSPLIMEQVQLETDIKKLESLRRAHNSSVINAKQKLEKDKGDIANLERYIANGKADLSARVDTYSEGKFSITVGKQKYTEKKDAGVALMTEATAKATEEGYTTIGSFAGFNIRVIKTHEGIKGILSGKQAYSFNTYPGNTTHGINHLIAVAEGINEKVTAWESTLSATKKDLVEQEKLSVATFARQAELEQKRARYNEVMSILNPKEEQSLDSVDDDVQEQSRSYLEGDIQDQQRTNTLTDREVLELAAGDVNIGLLTDAERDALSIFQKHLVKLEDLQTQRAEQGRLYKEQQFGAKVDREAAAATLNRMHILDDQIKAANDDLFTIEEKAVLRQILQKARKVVEKQEREHGQEMLKRWRDRRNNAEAIKKYRDRVRADVTELTNWVLHPNNKDAVKHIPDALKNTVIPFLSSINFMSKRSLNGGNATVADKAFMKQLESLQAALKQNQDLYGVYSGYNDLPPDFMDNLDNFIKSTQALVDNNSGEFVINQMTSEELRELSKVVRTLKKYIMQINRFHNNAMYQHVYEAGDSSIDFLKGLDRAGIHTGEFSNFVFWQQIRPAYAFERFGRGGEAIYDGLRQGQAKLAFNTKEIEKFTKTAYTAKEVRAWEKEIKSFTLGADLVKIPVSHLMSFYELSKDPEAKNHIDGGGIRVATYTRNGKKISDVGHILTVGEFNRLIGSLTDRQREVADSLQKYMATQGAKWGNYVSVARFGEELFTNPNYFPINSDGRHLSSTVEEHPDAAALYALLNMSFTKSRKEGANNRIILYSIFDVFANHMASMAQYNAMALPVLDALKWFNYQQIFVDDFGNKTVTASVREQLDRVYGVPEETRPGRGKQGYAETFVVNIIKAFNGTAAQGTPYDSLGLKSLRRYNMAQVAYNFRVVLQQPMAITRAGMILDYRSVLKGLKLSPAAISKNVEEMQKYSGIAAWKSLGFYDVNISRGLTHLIKHDATVMDKIGDVGMWGAEKADTLTWAAIWSASKEEVMRKQHLTPQSEGFYEAVSKLFEDVVYKTQVVDSVLTKNEFMRDKGTFARLVGSFMSEPATNASMLIDAVDKFNLDMKRGMSRQQAWQKNKKMVGRRLYVYGVGAVLLAAVQAAADALRDDDEYEEYGEKWLEAFIGNFVDELMPFNKLPIISDFYDLAKEIASIFGADTYGNPPQSVFMQWYDSLINGVEIIADKIMDEDTNYTWYGGIYKLLQAASGIVGLPMASATREIVTAWNNTVGAMAPSFKLKTYDPGDQNEIKYAYQDGYLTDEEAVNELLEKGLADTEDEAYFIVKGWEAGEGYSKYDEIFNAVRNGVDINEAMNELTAHGHSEKDVLSEIKGKIGEWYKGGEITKQQAINMLTKYIDMDSEEITATVNKWSCKVVTGIAFEDIKDEYLGSNITFDRAIDMYVRYGGYTKDKATETVTQWKALKETGIDYGDIKEEFLDGNITEAEAKSMYITYGGYSDEEAAEKVEVLAFVKKYPECDGISYSAVSGYKEHCEKAGVSPEVFYDAWKYNSSTSADVDNNGEAISGSKKTKVLNYIDSLNLTYAQKDSLYYAFGWAESKIYEAPWH